MALKHTMVYNSQKEILIMPEYGRNVQLLVNYAKTIEDPEYRQALVEKLIRLMHQMHPINRQIDDYLAKLWKHVFRISNYELEVIPAVGEIPTRKAMLKKPDKVSYPLNDTKFRHYGNNVQLLVKKALEMEEGPKRDGFIAVIGSYMKLAYRTWNKDHYVSDEVVKNDLKALSKGKLSLDDNILLDQLGSNNPQSSNSNKRRKRPHHSNSGKSSGGSNYRGNRNGKHKHKK